MEHLSVQYSDAKWKKKKYACASCPLACGAIYSIHEGGMDGDDFGRPEYETVGMFGSQVLCGDALLVQKCNHYCNEYGLDTISVGGTIAWAMECYEKGHPVQGGAGRRGAHLGQCGGRRGHVPENLQG